MKRKALLGTLVALPLSIACALGCTTVGADGPTTPPAAKNNSTAPQAATAARDISGDYTVAGANEDGSAYEGTLKVIKRGDVYQFHWDAGNQYEGIGVPNGSVVAVAFTGDTDGKGCGVVTYKLLANGMLDGKWGYLGVDDVGTEKATHTTGSGLGGDYNVTGTNPDRTAYQAKLSITPEGSGYSFSWSNNSSGFGIKQGSIVSVGIGGTRCGFVAYEIKPNGMLDGVWGGYGTSKTGTEKASKK